MRQIFLRSSTIAWVAYDPDTEQLVVGFQSGDVYQYEGVPVDVFVALLTDTVSHGRAFDAKIKKGAYPYQKIDPTEWDFHV